MAKADNKRYHHISDVWKAYAKQFLAANPDCFGRYKNKIENAVIYRKEQRRVVEINSYTAFHKRMRQYFGRAKTAVVQGEAINLYAGLGKICARRCERDFRHKQQVNWNKSNQFRYWDEEKGKYIYTKLVFFTEDDWCRIGWHKFRKVRNESLYEFKPSSSNLPSMTGFEQEFIEALNKDKFLKYRYLYMPLVPRKIA